ncbi:hypothetical protein [Deefgea piscis]|uniref:hypothetical protein n=1 Tax=Deefgea piscis TaxID=2739061 RepID=UPI001C7F547A|nr:hypothetical protein [Deefgea piscis]QZA80736.1 hypothetical protein K4H25_14740 [Deefgea piscis]
MFTTVPQSKQQVLDLASKLASKPTQTQQARSRNLDIKENKYTANKKNRIKKLLNSGKNSIASNKSQQNTAPALASANQ